MNARDKNENVNSGNARNKAAVAARNVVAVNKVDDKPDRMELRNGGRRLPPFCSSVASYNYRHCFSR
jgi:hypothetical protein